MHTLDRRSDDTPETYNARLHAWVSAILPTIARAIDREVLMAALLQHIDGEEVLEWAKDALEDRARIGRAFRGNR